VGRVRKERKGVKEGELVGKWKIAGKIGKRLGEWRSAWKIVKGVGERGKERGRK
jgi:hypothetical protein